MTSSLLKRQPRLADSDAAGRDTSPQHHLFTARRISMHGTVTRRVGSVIAATLLLILHSAGGSAIADQTEGKFVPKSYDAKTGKVIDNPNWIGAYNHFMSRIRSKPIVKKTEAKVHPETFSGPELGGAVLKSEVGLIPEASPEQSSSPDADESASESSERVSASSELQKGGIAPKTATVAEGRAQPGPKFYDAKTGKIIDDPNWIGPDSPFMDGSPFGTTVFEIRRTEPVNQLASSGRGSGSGSIVHSRSDTERWKNRKIRKPRRSGGSGRGSAYNAWATRQLYGNAPPTQSGGISGSFKKLLITPGQNVGLGRRMGIR